MFTWPPVVLPLAHSLGLVVLARLDTRRDLARGWWIHLPSGSNLLCHLSCFISINFPSVTQRRWGFRVLPLTTFSCPTLSGFIVTTYLSFILFCNSLVCWNSQTHNYSSCGLPWLRCSVRRRQVTLAMWFQAMSIVCLFCVCLEIRLIMRVKGCLPLTRVFRRCVKAMGEVLLQELEGTFPSLLCSGKLGTSS